MSFKDELIAILLASVTLGYILSFKSITAASWLAYAGIAALILLIHHFGYKISAILFDCSAETQLWSMRQFWFSKSSYFRRPFPLWLLFPLILIWISLGTIKWLAVITFNITPLPSRIKYRWRELTEWHIALVATGALIFNIVAALIAKAFGFDEFALLNLMFVLMSVLPIGQLDGTKIFFGSMLLWTFMFVLSIVMLLMIQSATAFYTVIAAVIIALFALIVMYLFYEAS